MTYPNEPGWKGKETSRQAAKQERGRSAIIAAKVLEELHNWPFGAAAEQIAPIVGASVYSVRSRLSEMQEKKRVAATEYLYRNENGKNVTIWKLV